MGELNPQIVDVLQRILEPLIRADGGSLYAVEATQERVALHLAGRFSGCPGNALVTRRVIGPLIASVAPRAQLTVTAGQLLPQGAQRIEPPP